MNIAVDSLHFHRNGVTGAPFHVALFRDPQEGPMLAVVFDAPQHVAVFSVAKLAESRIAFGENSWHGDQYEAVLRAAIQRHQDGESPRS